MIRTLIYITLLVAIFLPASAEVRLASIFTDHMVLQRDKPLTLWGWAEPGESITLDLAGQSGKTTADAQGRWTLRLAPLSAGGPHTLTVQGANTLSLKDILIGEVWLCSGQSNMAMKVQGTLNAEAEIAAAHFPQIRIAPIKRRASPKALANCKLRGWKICSPETVGQLSATAYYFGRHLHQHLKVPIGLITSSWGGTAIESWTPPQDLNKLESGRNLIQKWQQKVAEYDPKTSQQNYEKRLQAWKNQQNSGQRKRKKKPRSPIPPEQNPSAPGSLFNGMIAPLAPIAIRGVLWYQGERNATRIEDALEYRQELPCLIQGWRRVWGGENFPFLFVQLPNFEGKNPDALALNRESMLLSLSTPRTGMAITIDIGEARNIHPKNKQDVGKRLAWLAQKIAYGEDRTASGPLYRSMNIQEGQVFLEFEHVGRGLVTRGDKLIEFQVAGEDRKFVPAQATLQDDRVVVWSDAVPQPVAVRYAWTSNPSN